MVGIKSPPDVRFAGRPAEREFHLGKPPERVPLMLLDQEALM
jgi:hypothetical protein